ncbi:MAG: LapA family protein [Anaerobiospirillum succiniciproducens]|uniref:LapA family protein n=1 Tax=Anaerobiospirillum succiniciproducens TaxID=13335 RepID=UPI0026DA83AC|nr:LapA family protein [Anaerobiospirillum succiniciproducens]MDO4676849.1 LapA family protein [Anaerobiospirillum succiniciproducens]
MLKFWLYVIVLILFCILGLTIGSANESIVTFDFLFVKADLSLAMVMVIGLIVGIIVGLYISLVFTMKMWARAHNAKSEAKKVKKEAAKAIDKAKYDAEANAANDKKAADAKVEAPAK